MLSDLGHLSVWFALLACAYAGAVSVLGALRNDERLVFSGRIAAFATLPLVAIGCGGLWYSLLTNDFGVKYVSEVSSLATPTVFKITALWGSQDGSMLFWCLIMALFVATVMLRRWQRNEAALLPWVTLVCALVLGFFLFLELFMTNAFVRLDFPPPDGRGLNPLLRHPGMIIHPPLLYAGYTGILPSFAFCIAALVTRRRDNVWLTASRRWTLVGWVLLTAGLLLGGRWAHDVLGWGGYWGWDPSENMPFITWLLCTAFLHSQMIQEKRGMFKNWNVFLMMVTFASMFFGTAFIRSGLLTSVHAFAASDIGPWFMGAMAAILILCTGLWLSRLDTLKSENKLEAAFSREGIFLLQNVLFVSTAFTTFVGTVFPILSEGLTGNKITVGPPFYDQVAGPQMMALVVLMGIAPLMAWAKANARAMGRQAWLPFAIGLLATAALMALGRTAIIPALGMLLCFYTLAQTVFEYARGVRARMSAQQESAPAALLGIFKKNQRRYGGYFVHMGVVLMAIGALGKGFYGFDEIRGGVKLNETFTVGEYAFTYRGVQPVQCEYDDCNTTQAALKVTRNGADLSPVYPHIDYFPVQQHTSSIADVSGGFNEEVYVLLAAWERGGATASFHVYVNPLINWVWLGGIVMMLGFVMAFWKFDDSRDAVTVARTGVAGATGK
jgi:cytochrome c-type biogenesis protein CcmF